MAAFQSRWQSSKITAKKGGSAAGESGDEPHALQGRFCAPSRAPGFSPSRIQGDLGGWGNKNSPGGRGRHRTVLSPSRGTTLAQKAADYLLKPLPPLAAWALVAAETGRSSPTGRNQRQRSYRPFCLRHFQRVSVLCGHCSLARLRPLFRRFVHQG